MKKIIIFDAFGTLIDTKKTSLEATSKILSLQEKDIDPVTFYKELKVLHRKHFDEANINGFISEEDVYRKDLTILYKKYEINRDVNQDILIMFEAIKNRTLFDEVIEVINKLKEKYRVVIGSTTDNVHIEANMIKNHLEVHKVYTSEMIRKYKPAVDFYEYILNKEKQDAKDAIFVGDSLNDDVYGPSKLGITTVLIDRKNTFDINQSNIKPDYVINNLKELLDINF